MLWILAQEREIGLSCYCSGCLRRMSEEGVMKTWEDDYVEWKQVEFSLLEIVWSWVFLIFEERTMIFVEIR